MDPIKAKRPVEVVLGNTDIRQETKKVVDDVAQLREQDKEGYDEIFNQYLDIVNQGKTAVENGDWSEVGKLMDKNQELLRKMTVSCNEVEAIIDAAKANGAAGAKLTGTGRGGYVLCLTIGEVAQKNVAEAIEAYGFKTMRTTIG